jgi:hypothetical protein
MEQNNPYILSYKEINLTTGQETTNYKKIFHQNGSGFYFNLGTNNNTTIEGFLSPNDEHLIFQKTTELPPVENNDRKIEETNLALLQKITPKKGKSFFAGKYEGNPHTAIEIRIRAKN